MNTKAITFPRAILFTALCLLAIDPTLWLIHTWQDASYDSAGFWVFLLLLALFAWSLTSSRITLKPANTTLAYSLLFLTALTRLAGQILAINTLGAMALVIDVYAISILLAVQYRSRALSPFWLALLFAFTLPVERIIQRVMGFALQELSANLSCSGISLFSDSVICNGTRIALDNKQFLIDLPCAGSNSLVLLTILMTVLMVIARPNLHKGLIALLLIPLLAILSNVLRIILLVTGSLSDTLGKLGIDVMQQPWHDITGLSSLIPAIFAMLWFFHQHYRKPTAPHPFSDHIHGAASDCLQKNSWWLKYLNIKHNQHLSLLVACTFLILSISIISLQGKPLDTATITRLPDLPIMINGRYAQPVALLEKEKAYFTQYGGDAQKAIYGDRQLLVSKTSSPLRHLHAPDECLRGLGFDVSYLGSINEPAPSAIYKATSPTGETWKVAISFISNTGFMTTSVSEAVWHWVQQPATTWTSIQRISPWDSHYQTNRNWDVAVFNALEIHPLPELQQLVTTTK